MNKIKWDEVKDFFKGNGALRDIYFYPANINLWQKFINELKTSDYHLRYSFESQERAIPNPISIIFDKHELEHLLEIKKREVTFCCHFFDTSIIEVDFVPNDIINQERLNIVLDFMSEFSEKLEVTSVLTMENEFKIPFIEKGYESDFELYK